MEHILSTYFPIGFAIGTNDAVFDDRIKLLELKEGEQLIKRKNKKLCNRLGNGLILDITDTCIFKDWRKGADRLITDETFQKDFDIDAEMLKEIRSIVSVGLSLQCMLTIYSCGMATIELTLKDIDEKYRTDSLFRLAQAFEFSAYSDYSSETDFHRPLLEECQRILQFFVVDEQIKKLMTRIPEQEDFKYNFFPTFTHIFNSESMNKIEEMKIFREGRDDKYLENSVDGHKVFSSWYTVLVNGGESATTVVDLIRIYNLFHGVCEMMENIMNDMIYNLLSPEKTGDKLGLLIKLQLTGNLIINNTTLNLLTQNEELTAIFQQMDKNGNLESYHQSIKRSLDVCADIKNQFDHEIDKIEEEREKRRDNHINYFVIIFTSLTFVSVAADFLNLDQLTSEKIYDWSTRWSIYLSVFALLVVIISYLFIHKDRGHKK